MATKINIVVAPGHGGVMLTGYFLRSLIVSLSAKTWVIFATGATTVASIIVMLLPHSEKSGTKSRDT